MEELRAATEATGIATDPAASLSLAALRGRVGRSGVTVAVGGIAGSGVEIEAL
jgi:hypothetical protein